MDTMLSKALRDFLSGPLNQLVVNIAGDPTGETEREFNKFNRKEVCWLPVGAEIIYRMITLDRTKPFDPARFIGPGWSIWKGPAAGNGLEGEEEQDAQALGLAEIPLGAIVLETSLKDRETVITGEERLQRLRASGVIRLDAAAFCHFWNNQHLISQEWEKVDRIYFDGTTLRSPDGYRYTLFLFRHGKSWRWYADWLGNDRHARSPSACLASVSALPSATEA